MELSNKSIMFSHKPASIIARRISVLKGFTCKLLDPVSCRNESKKHKGSIYFADTCEKTRKFLFYLVLFKAYFVDKYNELRRQ